MSAPLSLTHFDVDENIHPFLEGTRYAFSLDEAHTNEITNKEHMKVLSCKSASHVTAAVLDTFPALQLVITRTVGTDHIDLDACKARNIAVYHIQNYGPHNIAEHAFGLMIAGARCIVTANNAVHRGEFSYKSFYGTSLKGKTLGVLGTGKIGTELIALAQAFGMKVIASDKRCDVEKGKQWGFACVSVDELLRQSDVVSLHIPLLPDTKHLINDEKIALMKDGVILVNTARGGIVDTDALVRNIGKFKAICLDVLEDEKNFSLDHPLLGYENVIITPHIAFYTDNALQNIARETDACVKRFLDGSDEWRVV